MHVYLSITARLPPAEIIYKRNIGGVGSGAYIACMGAPDQRVCYKVTQLQIPCIPNPIHGVVVHVLGHMWARLTLIVGNSA